MQQGMSIVFVGLFVAGMLVVALMGYKRTTTLKGFLLGGRAMGPWMSAFAYGTSYFSAVIFIGYAGKTGWQLGLPGTWVGVGNALLGSMLAWMILARPTRRMTHRFKAGTMPEFFEARYKSRYMKLVSAIIIFVFLVPYSASVYMGLGYLFQVVFPGLDYNLCMIFIAAVTGLYLVLGGYVATAMADFVQGIIMLIGIVVMVVCIVLSPQVGGIGAGAERLAAIDPNLTAVFGGENFGSLLSLVLLTSLGTWGLPQMVHKFYAIKSDDAIKKGTVISTVFALVIAASAYFVGAFGRLFYNNQLPEGGYDAVMPGILDMAFSGSTDGLIVFNIILLLVLSASMSTLSSVVLTSSSAVSVDLVKGYIKPDIAKKTSLRLMRILCLAFVLVSLSIAIMRPAIIMTLMSFSWGTVSGAFLGPFAWGLYGRFITRTGAWAGMISGAGVSLLLAVLSGFDAANSPLFGVIAMAAGLVVTPLVSLITKKLPEEHVKAVFAPERDGAEA